jgi:very-long-chain enoyl-CoA reductase
VPTETTVEDIKVLIARQARIRDHNRIGLFYPSTKKTLKDRKAKIVEEEDVMSTGELLVKDLGKRWTLHTEHSTSTNMCCLQARK